MENETLTNNISLETKQEPEKIYILTNVENPETGYGFTNDSICSNIPEGSILISEEIYNKFFQEQALGKCFKLNSSPGITFEEIFTEYKPESSNIITTDQKIDELSKQLVQTKLDNIDLKSTNLELGKQLSQSTLDAIDLKNTNHELGKQASKSNLDVIDLKNANLTISKELVNIKLDLMKQQGGI